MRDFAHRICILEVDCRRLKIEKTQSEKRKRKSVEKFDITDHARQTAYEEEEILFCHNNSK